MGCQLCDGTGFIREQKDGIDFARPCVCRRQARQDSNAADGTNGPESQKGDEPPEQRGLVFARPIKQRFRDFLEAHPEVYDQLVDLARRAKAAGHKHYSARGLWEYLRFNSILCRGEDHFKLNDHYIAHFARLIMQREPDLAGFFETRQLRTE